MTSIGFPYRLAAPLSRIDARWKLAALIPAGAVVGALHTLGPACAALVGAVVIAALARIPLRWYAVRMGILATSLAVFLIFLPLTATEDKEQWSVGPLLVYPQGITFAVVLLLKALALVSLLLAAATTASVSAQLKALRALRVPGLAVQLMGMAMRYLAVLWDEFGRMRIALRVRGHRRQPTLRSLHTASLVWGTLIVRATDRAERVAQAMRCRGFDGQFHSLAEFRTGGVDVAFWAAVTTASAGLLLWDVLAR
jgi:cobalt/nickel transport system permease protein